MSLRAAILCAALALAALTATPVAGATTAATTTAAEPPPAPFADDAAVRSVLLDVPGVQQALATGEQRRAAVLVNQWLAPRIAAAAYGQNVIPTYGKSAYEDLNAFAARAGGVFCDGAADTLLAALQLLGISASRFDFGFSAGGMTHTTVVVAAEGRWWLVDPSFGLDLQGADGRPLDLLAAWQAAADGTRGAVTMRTTDLSARAMVGVPKTTATCADGMTRWTMCALPSYLGGFAAAMRAAGYPTGEHGLLLLSLRSPLIDPDFYGVPPALPALRAGVQAEPHPVRIVGTARRGSIAVVAVRDVRSYPLRAMVAIRVGTTTQVRSVLVAPGVRTRVVFHVGAGPLAAAHVAVARYPAA
jgi:hypothetical protein